MGEHDPTIAYLTDVEGLWPKLEAFARDNPAVALSSEGHIDVAPGCLLVFGGDAIDRGPHARKIVSALVDAKARQPRQVVLLAGNRDINKLRLPRELAGHPPSKTPDDLRSAPRPTLLRFIFEHTMGARAAFACRRDELAREAMPHDDESVVESFLRDMRPDGDITRLLASSQLAFRSGNTLFVHGAVTSASLGHVPGATRSLDDVDAWVDALNRWYDDQMGRFLAFEMGPDGMPAYTPLVAYQAPLPGTKANQTSVVYGRPTDDDGNPHLPSRDVVDRLARAGIDRLVVGHTPIGDTPAPLRDDGFELLVADNSYSPVETGACVLITRGRVESRAVAGVAGAAEEVRFSMSRGDGSPVGRRLEASGHLVKGQLSSGDFLLHRALPGYRVDQRVVSPRDLARERLVAP